MPPLDPSHGRRQPRVQGGGAIVDVVSSGHHPRWRHRTSGGKRQRRAGGDGGRAPSRAGRRRSLCAGNGCGAGCARLLPRPTGA
eukprot:scaffold6824_cov118-Isochrysis_galbana.AAC.5